MGEGGGGCGSECEKKRAFFALSFCCDVFSRRYYQCGNRNWLYKNV